jgi:RNA recognition motif-containing protein
MMGFYVCLEKVRWSRNYFLGRKKGKSKGCTVVISNLSLDISAYEIELRLSSYGSLRNLSVRSSADGATQYATATFTDSTSAEESSRALHGTSVDTWVKEKSGNGKQRISVLMKLSEAPGGAAVKVQWYAPSRAAFVHLRQRFEAEKVAKVCNGKELHGRVVSVKFQRPSLNQRTLFTAWMSNLAETVSKSNIVSFVQKNAKCKVLSIDQGDLPFPEHQGPAIVEKLLNRHGHLVSFQTSPCSPKELKRRALARFSDAKQAEEAARHFKQTSSIKELGGNRLFVQRMFSLKYTLPGRF